MKSQQKIRLTKLVKEFNVSIDRILSFLHEKGYISNYSNDHEGSKLIINFLTNT